MNTNQERDRLTAAIADWFTLPPRCRTKAKLIEMVLSAHNKDNGNAWNKGVLFRRKR
jgi:hypothetical protein